MDVSVQEVDITSEGGTQRKYFLRVDWEGRDLGSGFHVLLTDGELAWRGEVTADMLQSEAEELEMLKERYVQDLHQALTGAESSGSYNFTLTPLPTATSTTSSTTTASTLSYEKVQKDISFQLGSVALAAVAEPAEAVRELLELGVQRAGGLDRQNHRLQLENHSLSEELKYITAKLQHYAEGKEALEAELYSRFVLVLNEKKKKLRGLQQSLKLLQQEHSRSPDKSSKPTQSQASHQKESPEDEYGGSTEEEEEEEEEEGRGEEAAGPATGASAAQDGDSDSLLGDGPGDITDVAPCRKRRFRALAAASDPATSDPAAKRAPPETSARHRRRRVPPPGGSVAGQQKSLRGPDPTDPAASPSTEDLFDDF